MSLDLPTFGRNHIAAHSEERDGPASPSQMYAPLRTVGNRTSMVMTHRLFLPGHCRSSVRVRILPQYVTVLGMRTGAAVVKMGRMRAFMVALVELLAQ